MNRIAFHAYQERILSILKLIGETNSLRIPEVEIEEDYPKSIQKKDSVIPFKKIK